MNPCDATGARSKGQDLIVVHTSSTGPGEFSAVSRKVLDQTEPIPEGAVWIDLINPTRDEEVLVESQLKLELPTREDMSEIEASSRLYREGAAT